MSRPLPLEWEPGSSPCARKPSLEKEGSVGPTQAAGRRMGDAVAPRELCYLCRCLLRGEGGTGRPPPLPAWWSHGPPCLKPVRTDSGAGALVQPQVAGHRVQQTLFAGLQGRPISLGRQRAVSLSLSPPMSALLQPVYRAWISQGSHKR